MQYWSICVMSKKTKKTNRFYKKRITQSNSNINQQIREIASIILSENNYFSQNSNI